jgi:predicted DNA-binding WGR domain protein
VRETWFETEAAASEAGAKVRQRKEKRGYRVLTDNRACGNNNQSNNLHHITGVV